MSYLCKEVIPKYFFFIQTPRRVPENFLGMTHLKRLNKIIIADNNLS